MLRLAKVVGVNPQAHTVDLVLLDRMDRVANVQVLAANCSTNSGSLGLPTPTTPSDPYGVQNTGGRDVFAYVAFAGTIPIVLGFKVPELGQMTFADGRQIHRHESDVYSSLTKDGDWEMSFPNGLYMRVAASPAHEDLTGKDFDGQWKVVENVDAELHVMLGLPNGAGSVHMDPVGNATLGAKALTINAPQTTAQGALNVTGPASVGGLLQVAGASTFSGLANFLDGIEAGGSLLISEAQVGAPSGVASLDASGRVPLDELPLDFVNQVDQSSSDVSGALAEIAQAQAAISELNSEIAQAEQANADVAAALSGVSDDLAQAQQSLGAGIAQAQTDATTVALTALSSGVAQYQQNQSIKAATYMPDGTKVNFALTQEVTFRQQGDAANAAQINGIGVTVGDQAAQIGDLQEVTVDLQAQKADSSDLEELQTNYDAFSSSVSEFEDSTSTSLAAQAETETNLQADIGGVQSTLADEQTARVTADEALTANQETQASDIANNSALISGLSSTVANNESSQTQINDDLQSNVGDLQATVSEQAGTLVDLAGKLLAYLVFKAAAGGDSAQISLAADNNTSAIQFICDVLSIASDQGGTPIPILTATAGVVGIATKLLVGNSLLLDPVTGTLYASLGSVAFALGGPFGANSNLVLWFGPSMALSAMTTSNGKFWLDNAGDAFFGGSIRAGALCNSQQGTDTSATAQTVLGPFGTNGGPITIACSYSYSRVGVRTPANSTISGAPSTTISLYRTIAGGSETLVASQNVSGAASFDNTGDGYASMSEQMSGSFTYSDSAGGTQNRTYRLAVSNRVQSTFNGNTYNNQPDGVGQTLGIVSSEG